MITLRFDTILQAVTIERGDNQRVYRPSPASMRRILQMTCRTYWVYLPSSLIPSVHAWQFVSWRGHRTVVQ